MKAEILKEMWDSHQICAKVKLAQERGGVKIYFSDMVPKPSKNKASLIYDTEK